MVWVDPYVLFNQDVHGLYCTSSLAFSGRLLNR